MKKERFNEILGVLIEQNENIETAKLLQELKEGFDDSIELKYNELQEKYNNLEKEYIDTFKNSLVETEPSKVEEPVKEEEMITIDSLFTEQV